MPAFLEEDGTGVTAATSYVSVAYADNYLGSSWASTTQAKEAALMAASEYADVRWGEVLKSWPLTETQGLEMPRTELKDRYGRTIEGLPDGWKKAICNYAKPALTGSLYPTTPTGSAKEVKKKKTIVGPITTELEYLGIKSSASYLAFPLADKLARPYTSNSSTVKVIR